jgi:hypothetical protein
MNQSSRHRGCTHAQPHFSDFFYLFPIRKLGCVGGCKLKSDGRS